MPAEYYWPSPHNTQICRNHHSQICGSSLAAIHSHLLCSRNSPDSSLSQMLRCRWRPCSSLDRPIAAGCRLAKLWVSIGASVPSLRSYGTEAALQAVAWFNYGTWAALQVVAWFNYGTVAVRLALAGFYYGTVAVRLALAGFNYGTWAALQVVAWFNYGTWAALQVVAWLNYGTWAAQLAVAGLKSGAGARLGMVVLKNYRCSAKYVVCEVSDTVRFKRLYSVNSI